MIYVSVDPTSVGELIQMLKNVMRLALLDEFEITRGGVLLLVFSKIMWGLIKSKNDYV